MTPFCPKTGQQIKFPSSAPVEKEDFSEVRKTFHEMNKKLMDEIIGYKEENARLRSLIEELIPIAVARVELMKIECHSKDLYQLTIERAKGTIQKG